MIQIRTRLVVADNSGADSLMTISFPGPTGKRIARLGDVIKCVVRGAVPTGAVKDREMVKVVIVRTRKEVRRSDGSYVRFDDNAGVVIDKDGNPLGTRIFGPVARELRDLGFAKIISLAPEVW
ncbi:MAG: 50S ribosomal protein L14 [candidate division WWE3 bacterium]|nr:50S ribosomal protein L14 [candidate division WWE3 bacterium]